MAVAVAAFAMVVLTPIQAFATHYISGVVQNSRGAALVNVRVYALWASTDVIMSSGLTNASGAFSFGVDPSNDIAGDAHLIHIFYQVPSGSEYRSDYYVSGNSRGALLGGESTVALTHSGFLIYVDDDKALTTHVLADVTAPTTPGIGEMISSPPPTHSSFPASTGWVNRERDIYFGADDSGVGVKEAWYQLAASSASFGAETKVTGYVHVGEGAWKIRYRAVDYDGNWSAYTTPVNILDDITNPVTTLGRTIRLEWAGKCTLTPTDNLSGVAKTEYTINGGAVQLYAAGSEIAPSADGVYTVNYWSTDVAGNKEAVKTVTLKVDRTPPVTTSSGVSAGWTGESAHITLTATDGGSGIKTIYYKIASGSVQTYLGPFVVDGDGSTDVAFWSEDVAGNIEPTHTVAVKIDRTPPFTGATGIPSTWTSQTVSVSIVASDTGSGVQATLYAINGGAPQPYSAPFAISNEGQTNLTFWSTDKLGLTESVKNATVRIDRTPPLLSLTQSAGSGGIVVSAAAQDALSGIALVRFRVNGQPWSSGQSVQIPSGEQHTVEFEARDGAGNATSVVQQVPLGSNPVAVGISADATIIDAGQSVALTGTVRVNGVSTGLLVVQLQRQLSNKKWANVLDSGGIPVQSTTSALGEYAFAVSPTAITRFRVVCPRSLAYDTATSASELVNVRAVLTITAPGSARKNAKFTVKGSVRPKHRAKISLRFDKLRSSGNYTHYKTISFYSSKNGAYSRRLSLPKGTYHVSAAHPRTSQYVPSSSAVLELVVR